MRGGNVPDRDFLKIAPRLGLDLQKLSSPRLESVINGFFKFRPQVSRAPLIALLGGRGLPEALGVVASLRGFSRCHFQNAGVETFPHELEQIRIPSP